ncbi:hypothetical protein VPHK459_0092 [Vibrio phage K459]
MIHTFSAGVTENCVVLDPKGTIEVDVPYELRPGVIVIGYDMVNNIKRLEQLPDFGPYQVFETFFKPHTCTETKPVLKEVMYATYESVCRLADIKPLPRHRTTIPSGMTYKDAVDD